MKFLIILTVSLTSVFGQLNADFENCPACPDVDETVFLPSSSKCADYFVCEHGVPIRKTCPEGLHWDDSAKACNWPDQISPPCTGKIWQCVWLIKIISNNTIDNDQKNFNQSIQKQRIYLVAPTTSWPFYRLTVYMSLRKRTGMQMQTENRKVAGRHSRLTILEITSFHLDQFMINILLPRIYSMATK